MTPIFYLIGPVCYAPSRSDGPPLGLSLSHLVPEIIGPKGGIMFHQKCII